MRKLMIAVLFAAMPLYGTAMASLPGCDFYAWYGRAVVGVEYDVLYSPAQMTGMVYNGTYSSCGPPALSLREDDFSSCSDGLCTASEHVRGLSFALGGYQTVEEHFDMLTDGWALGWHSQNYLNCGFAASFHAAGAQCASYVAQIYGWGGDFSTVSLADAMNLLSDIRYIKYGDALIKKAVGGDFGHSVFIMQVNDGLTEVITAECTESTGKVSYLSWPLIVFDGYDLYRHPDCDMPWAVLASANVVDGAVVFSSVKESSCGGYRLEGSDDGVHWAVASATLPATGGGSTYTIFPEWSFQYLRVESLDLRTEPTWVVHDVLDSRRAHPEPAHDVQSHGRPTMTVIPEDGIVTHPGYLSYVSALREQGFDVRITVPYGTADEMFENEHSSGRMLIPWSPEHDRRWEERIDDKIKKTQTGNRTMLLMAPQSLHLPLEDWAWQKETIGWNVVTYEYDPADWMTALDSLEHLKQFHDIVTITAFGSTHEWNASGTTLPGDYIDDSDSTIGYWTDNVLSYTSIEAPKGITVAKRWTVGYGVGVVPVDSVEDYWRAYDRMVATQHAWAYTGWDRLASWGIDEDFDGNSGDIVRTALVGVVDSLTSGVGSLWMLDSLWDSTIPTGCWNRADAAVDHLNEYNPSMIVLGATASRPDTDGSWYGDGCSYHPFTPGDFSTDGKYALLVGLSCGVNGIDVASQSSSTVQFMKLFDNGLNVSIGPTRSIKQRIATEYEERFVRIWKEHYTDDLDATTVTIGEIHMRVRNELLEVFSDAEGETYVKSIILVGDPSAYPPGYRADHEWVSVSDGVPSANTFVLHKPSPNPFNPVTTISFTLDAPGLTDLAVYNVAGQRVMTLVTGTQQAGEHTITWDGRNDADRQVTSGVYFCRLVSGEHIETQRLVFVH